LSTKSYAVNVIPQLDLVAMLVESWTVLTIAN